MKVFSLRPSNTLKTYFVVCAVAAVFSLFTLWLLDSQLRYGFFILEFLAITNIFIILHPPQIQWHFKASAFSRIVERYLHIVTFLLPSFALILLVLNSLHFYGGIVQDILSLLTTSILPGYTVLKISGINRNLSILEVIIFSSILSFILSGGLNLLLLSLNTELRTSVFLIIYVIVGLVGALHALKRDNKANSRTKSLSNNIDLLALVLSLLFYVLIYLLLYPDATLLPNADIARHYRASVILSRSPDFYVDSTYALFHGYEASVQMLSSNLISPYQNMLVSFNLILPLAVYAMAKRYLGPVNKKIPAIATILYVFLSNYSFIYFSQLKLQGTIGHEFQLLAGSVAEKTFNGTVNFLQPFVFLFPLSVSLIIFVSGLCLLKNSDIPRSKFVVLMSVLILAMYLSHVTEAVIFAVILVFYAFVRTPKLRLREGLYSALIAFSTAAIFVIYSSTEWGLQLRKPEVRVDLLFTVFVPIILVIFAIFYSKISIRFRIGKKMSDKQYRIISIALALTYLGSFVMWFYDKSFGTSAVYDIGVVPWFIYPLMLGTAGLLSILSIKYIGRENQSDLVTTILLTIGFLFIMGRALSFININFFVTGYWEKRFIFFLFLFCCLVAPIPIIRFKEKLFTNRTFLNNTIVAAFLSVIVLSGFSSIVLQAEYLYEGTRNYRISDTERQAVDFLRSILDKDSRAFAVGLSKSSRDSLTFAAPPYLFSKPEIMQSARNPEIPMMSLTAHNLPHAYVYMHKRDFELLKDQPQAWFKNYLTFLPVVFSNKDVTIYNSTQTNYPSLNSRVHFLIPSHQVENSKYSYFAMSGSKINYTTFYDIDKNSLSGKTVILGFDPTEEAAYNSDFSNLAEWSPLSGKWNVTENGLTAGDRTNEIEKIILSPIKGKEFIGGTIFSVPQVNNNSAKYASIVYSYNNVTNFKYANVMFYNGRIYLSLASVLDGVRTFYPSWPGILSKEPIAHGANLNLTLSVNRNSEQLLLNGSQYITRKGLSFAGDLGLGYGRLDNLNFKSFTIQNLDPKYTRKTADYIEFVKKGGQLLVLNPNGYHDINSYLTRYGSDRSQGNGGAELKSLGPTDQSSTYRGPFQTSIYQIHGTKFRIPITEMTIGNGKVTYIDIFPSIREWIQKKISANDLYSILTKVMDGQNIDRLSVSPISFKNIQAIFGSLFATGLINIHSNSFLLPSNFEFDRVELTSGPKNIKLQNVSVLSIDEYKDGRISTDTLSIHDGEGLYTNTYFTSKNKATTLNLVPGGTVNILSAGMSRVFKNVSSISFFDSRVYHLSVRNPTISILGVSEFDKFSSGKLYSKTGVDGQTLKVVGNTSMSILFSDEYTLLNNISVNGPLQRIPPLSQFDEVESLLQLPPFLSNLYSVPPLVKVLTLVPFIIVAAVLLFEGRNKSNRGPELQLDGSTTSG